MGRNLNQSYLTRGSQTPTGKKEFKFDGKSEFQKEENEKSRKSGSECDEYSQMELSRDYIQEKTPQNVFNTKHSSKLDHSENDIQVFGKKENGLSLDKSLDQSYNMYQRVSTARHQQQPFNIFSAMRDHSASLKNEALIGSYDRSAELKVEDDEFTSENNNTRNGSPGIP